jgi:hypothetical protein
MLLIAHGQAVHGGPKARRAKGFAVIPRCGFIERTLAAHRRLARDDERLPEHTEA